MHGEHIGHVELGDNRQFRVAITDGRIMTWFTVGGFHPYYSEDPVPITPREAEEIADLLNTAATILGPVTAAQQALRDKIMHAEKAYENTVAHLIAGEAK